MEEARQYANDEGTELNMVFQFEHVGLDGDAEFKWSTRKMPLVPLKENLTKWQKGLDEVAWNSIFFCNHDQPRIVNRLGDPGSLFREASAKCIATCLHMMQGTPFIYQGEELGMTNIKYEIEEYRDIETCNMFKERIEAGYDKADVMNSIYVKSRDNARTPMQWDASENAGFTTGTPWIKVNPNYTSINAASQVNDPDSVFSYYKKLVHLRKEYDVLVDGRFTMLLPEDENIFAYTRENEDSKLLVVCNFFDKTLPMPLNEETEGMELLLGNYGEAMETEILKPYEARMYIKK